MSVLSINHVIEALNSVNPWPRPCPLLWHYFSSEGNNKVNTVMLNHFPACKWAHIKDSILRRAFYRALNSFIKIRGEKDG